MLHRYGGNIGYVLRIPLHHSIKLISTAMEEDLKEYYFRLYLVIYQNMNEKTFKSFEEFYEEVRPKKITIDTRNKNEIISEIIGIEKSFQKGVD